MDENSAPPHVLIFPYPAQGHINSMLKLAELLCLSGLHITFLVSAKIKDGLINLTNVQSRFDSYPGFFLESLPKTFLEVPAQNVMENYNSLKAVSQPFLSDLILKNRLGSDTRRPVTFIISDGVFSFLIDIAKQIGIPIYYFRTISSCAFWAYFSTKKLIESQELPFQDQQVNSRFVSQVWKLGLDMKDTCDRVIIENMVRDLMVVRREEFVTVASKTAKLARNSVREGGSSYSDFDRLVEDIKKSNSKLMFDSTYIFSKQLLRNSDSKV